MLTRTVLSISSPLTSAILLVSLQGTAPSTFELHDQLYAAGFQWFPLGHIHLPLLDFLRDLLGPLHQPGGQGGPGGQVQTIVSGGGGRLALNQVVGVLHTVGVSLGHEVMVGGTGVQICKTGHLEEVGCQEDEGRRLEELLTDGPTDAGAFLHRCPSAQLHRCIKNKN